ncbi:MAG TPA: oligosaccharide flippase family protein [Bacteroidota bacterium]|nr:oligosaccharide flippase family protein [Bacteroidota bacterium]
MIWGSVSVVVRAIGNILFFSLAGRFLGVNDFGVLTLAVTISQIFSSVVDYGFNLYIITQVAEKPSEIIDKTRGILPAKLFLTVICTVFIFGISLLLNYSLNKIVVIGIVWLGMIFYSYGVFYNTLFRAVNNFRVESNANILLNIAQILLVLIGFVIPSLFWMTVAYTFSRILFGIFSYRQAIYEFGALSWKYNFSAIFQLLRQTLPFGIQTILALIYFQSDTVFLSYFSSNREVGLYQSAMRLVVGISVISDLISSSFFPSLVTALQQSVIEMNKHVKTMHRLIIVSGFLISGSLFLFAKEIILVLYGDTFIQAEILLQLLSIVVLLRFFGTTYGIMLTILGKQKWRSIAVGISVVTNITSLLYFTPRFASSGAAIGSIITHFVLLTIYAVGTFLLCKTIFIEKSDIRFMLLFTVVGIVVVLLKPISIILASMLFITVSVLKLWQMLKDKENEALPIFEVSEKLLNKIKN